MEPAPWRSRLERALAAEGDAPTARYAQLATTAADGAPTVRTVVVRGFLPGSDAPIVTIDARSPKAAHLGRDPRAELCWYFPSSREQFRLAGTTRLVGPDHPDAALAAARLDAWTALSPASRRSFSWPDPGRPRTGPFRFAAIDPDPVLALATFLLLVLDPAQVDYLDLKPDPHARTTWGRSGVGPWREQALNA